MIQFNDITSQWKEIEKKTLPKIIDFMRTGPYILGPEVDLFEKEFASYCGTKYAVGISNGTDGLKLAVQYAKHKLKENPNVIVPANGHVSDAFAPLYNELKIHIIDCDEFYNLNVDIIKQRCVQEPCIVIAVHLYGQGADITKIKKILPNSIIIEDCSQANGASIHGQKVGSIGNMGVFSLYPTKNLGAIGDAGIITTNDEDCYNYLKAIRNYGSIEKNDYQYVGHNNRMDELQAIILREKLKLLDGWIKTKIDLAQIYLSELNGVGDLVLPGKAPYNDGSTYHIFPIRTKSRTSLKNYLDKNNIPTLIHYPITIPKLSVFANKDFSEKTPKAIKYSNELLSLPIHPYLSKNDIMKVCSAIKNFFGK